MLLMKYFNRAVVRESFIFLFFFSKYLVIVLMTLTQSYWVRTFCAVAVTFQGSYMKDFFSFSSETTAPPAVGNWFALTVLLDG